MCSGTYHMHLDLQSMGARQAGVWVPIKCARLATANRACMGLTVVFTNNKAFIMPTTVSETLRTAGLTQMMEYLEITGLTTWDNT